MEKCFSPMPPLILTDKQIFFEDDCACADSPRLLASPKNIFFENDCACADTEFAATDRAKGNQLYKKVEDAYVADLPQGFQLAFSPYAPQGPSALNATAWERWQSFAAQQPLAQEIDFLLADQNLIVPAGITPRLKPIEPETLTVWLHVTNACNLDCPYCYVRKSSASMSDETGLDAVERIFQTALKRQFKDVKLKYAGGEASLHFRLIQKLSARAQELSAKYGISLQQVVLSNGTHIGAEDVAWMRSNQARMMISLDGVGEVQDRMRPYRSGKGSFEAVRKTVDEVLLPQGFQPMFTVTITQQNAGGVSDAVRWVLERDLPVSLNFYRHKPNSALDLAAEENALIEGMLAAYKVYEEILPSRPFLNGLLDRVQAGAHLHTCGAGSSYLVITHEGFLAQCQMQMENPVSHVLSNDLISQVQAGPLNVLSVEQKDACSACAYRYRCAGGCPLETHRASGRWNAPSPNCRIYRTLLPFALRLEGLRLLKAHRYLH